MAKKQAAHRQDLESRALKGELMKSMMGTILGYTTFGGSMFGAVDLLLHDKPIQSPCCAHRCTPALPLVPRSTLTSSNQKPTPTTNNCRPHRTAKGSLQATFADL
jgi:hypothetical protein